MPPSTPVANILAVDDQPNNLRLLTDLLTPQGYTVQTATDGQQALRSAVRSTPDLILLDIVMPGLSGYDVCACLKSDPATRSIPVIFLSGLEEAFDKVRAFEIGGADYITKPFQAAEVSARIRHQLQVMELRRQLENQNIQLQVAEAASRQASEAKSQFLAQMNHELRTPLNAIINLTELMLMDPDRSTQDQDCLQIIADSGQHLLTLVNDVLDMVKIESGRETLMPQPCSIPKILADLKAIFRMQVNSELLNLVFECDPRVPRQIVTDPTKLRQVLINLLGNAVKFTDKGYVALRVRPSEDYQRLIFLVEDTGSGIAAEELPKLFQPFEQTKSGRSLQQGSGLGLAISQRFVTLMGGQIQVDSTVGQGTRFTFDIAIELVQEMIPSHS